MTRIRTLSDFVLDDNTGVYMLPGGKSNAFNYSDGGEDKVLHIIQNVSDRSSNSIELESAIDDWATKYHFSNLRTNILRALDLLRTDSTILEIGSGCGALTRYFGENVKSVHSIEGDFRRAYITKERCKDLNNVRVHWSTLQDVSFDKQYDMASLIGVLEYAPMFYKDHKEKEDACLAMLRDATSALKEDGILIIAIENKLGLKYWSGCTEDHTGRLFDGIHDYPKDNIAVTFSRGELKTLLEKAQLKYYEFYYPFPDYKLTDTVFKEVAEPELYYLHNWVTTPFEDYHGNREFSFNEGMAIKSVSKARLLYELSNSFLVVASMVPIQARTHALQYWIAKRFSTNRIVPFKTVTILKKNRDSGILLIQKQKLFDVEEPGGLASLRLIDSKWIPGDLLQFSLYEAVCKEKLFENLLGIFRHYHNKMIENYFIGEIDPEGYHLLNSEAVDFVPWNIIVSDKGMLGIDQEWMVSQTISADYVLFRAVYLFLFQQYSFILREISDFAFDIDLFTISLLRMIYSQYDTERHKRNKAIEEEFQSFVTGHKVKMSTPEMVKRIRDPFLWKKEAQINSLEVQINSLLSSWSWKITAPLRRLLGLFKGRP